MLPLPTCWMTSSARCHLRRASPASRPGSARPQLHALHSGSVRIPSSSLRSSCLLSSSIAHVPNIHHPPGVPFSVPRFSSGVADVIWGAGLSAEEATMCAWLASHGPASLNDLMGAFHLPKTTAHRRMMKLVADGWVEVQGAGRTTRYTVRHGSVPSGTNVER